ncbi:HAD family hydrolase [Mitsuokella sp.]|uniref:HAD family hydrolase n=1 Tax=Mitsuokella TaxID=52225 RepID=UPI0029E0E7AC|nr:HAD family phosphatase [Mitsuokella sp.]MDD6383113.1 HAD family phosphatase [Selenomonadaceae bacterium]MDY4475772.1 HAD family phosphatase [Mitsuokella sp.]
MKAFIYDMDGVIVDTEPLHMEAIVHVLNKMGVHDVTIKDLLKYQGTTDLLVYEDLKKQKGFSPEPQQAVRAKDYVFKRLLAEKGVQPIEGIVDLIHKTNALRQQGIKTAIASSSPNEFIHFVVDHLGISDCFDCLVSGTDLPESKPNPAIYLQTAAYLCVDPQECVVLEDSGNGARAAKGAGMTCIGYAAPGSTQDLSCCDMLVAHIADIDLQKLS